MLRLPKICIGNCALLINSEAHNLRAVSSSISHKAADNFREFGQSLARYKPHFSTINTHSSSHSVNLAGDFRNLI